MPALDRIAEILTNGLENEILSIISKDYFSQISEDNIPNHYPLAKFGQNAAVAATDEDIWDGSAVYVYLSSGEILQVSSGDVDDQGDELSAGTADGGSVSTLIDSGATFASDGVAAGDLVIDDDNVQHGIVLSLTGETQINLVLPVETSLDGVAYRVINANDTGAAVVWIQGLDDNYDLLSEYVVLATAASVATVGTYLRIFRAKVVLAGSSGYNEGLISIKDNADTQLLAAITALMGQSLMAIWTVPDGFTAYLTNFYAATALAKATNVSIYVRAPGEAWQVKRTVNINAAARDFTYPFPLKITQRSDVAIRANAAGGGGLVDAGFNLWYEANE